MIDWGSIFERKGEKGWENFSMSVKINWGGKSKMFHKGRLA